jgi:ankyrin repeat protein
MTRQNYVAMVLIFIATSISVHAQTINIFTLAKNGSPQEIQDAVDIGANVKAQDFAFDTPLMLAAKNNPNPEVITILLKAGANIEAFDVYFHATVLLWAAAYNPNPEVITTLLQAGANIAAKDVIYGATMLSWAAKYNSNPDMIFKILKTGVDVNAQDRYGMTALMYAAKKNQNAAVVLALLNAGSNAGIKDIDEKDAFDYALGNEKLKNSAAFQLLQKNHEASPSIASVGSETGQNASTMSVFPDYTSGSWHLVLRPAQIVTAKYTEEVREGTTAHPIAWSVFISVPPTLQAQKLIASELTIKSKEGLIGSSVQSESSGLMREYRQAMFPAGQSIYPDGFSEETVYSVQLFSRDLVPGAVTDPNSVPSLTTAEEQQYLSPNSHIFWSKGPIHDWMIQRNLVKRDNEKAIAFAWRVSQSLHEDFDYGQSIWNDVNDVCLNRTGDCGGLSSVIIAVLRANGIPARLNLGIWAVSSTNDPVAPTDVPPVHARLEFYCRDAGGWIPIDGGGLVVWRANWKSAFGHENGELLTTMIETDMVVQTEIFGAQTVLGLQMSPYFLAKGTVDYGQTAISTLYSYTCLHPYTSVQSDYEVSKAVPSGWRLNGYLSGQGITPDNELSSIKVIGRGEATRVKVYFPDAGKYQIDLSMYREDNVHDSIPMGRLYFDVRTASTKRFPLFDSEASSESMAMDVEDGYNFQVTNSTTFSFSQDGQPSLSLCDANGKQIDSRTELLKANSRWIAKVFFPNPGRYTVYVATRKPDGKTWSTISWLTYESTSGSNLVFPQVDPSAPDLAIDITDGYDFLVGNSAQFSFAMDKHPAILVYDANGKNVNDRTLLLKSDGRWKAKILFPAPGRYTVYVGTWKPDGKTWNNAASLIYEAATGSIRVFPELDSASDIEMNMADGYDFHIGNSAQFSFAMDEQPSVLLYDANDKKVESRTELLKSKDFWIAKILFPSPGRYIVYVGTWKPDGKTWNTSASLMYVASSGSSRIFPQLDPSALDIEMDIADGYDFHVRNSAHFSFAMDGQPTLYLYNENKKIVSNATVLAQKNGRWIADISFPFPGKYTVYVGTWKSDGKTWNNAATLIYAAQW